MMNVPGDALWQTFMSQEDYEGLREEENVCTKLLKPLAMAGVTILWAAVVVSMMIMVDVVFAVSGDDFPFCQQRRLAKFNMAVAPGGSRRGDVPSHVYTEEEAVDIFWLVVFLPSSVVFVCSSIYLFAGISVAYIAPRRHSCLKVVENDCCASSRGGVQCLATLNFSFMIAFVLLSIFLGCFVLSLGTSCSIALFWCYEVACWGLVILLASTAFFLQRKAAVIMELSEYYGHHERGVELLEAIPVIPQADDRVVVGVKSSMGPGPAHTLHLDDTEGNTHVTLGGVGDVWEGDASKLVESSEHLSKSRIG